MRRKLVLAGIYTAVSAALWLSASSLLFLILIGQFSTYPWPNRLWMWLGYLLYPPRGYESVVSEWLIISSILAALPLLAIGALIVRRWWRRPVAAVYGKTAWATKTQMQAGGLSTSKRPF